MYFIKLIIGHHGTSYEDLTSPEICQNFLTKPNPRCSLNPLFKYLIRIIDKVHLLTHHLTDNHYQITSSNIWGKEGGKVL